MLEIAILCPESVKINSSIIHYLKDDTIFTCGQTLTKSQLNQAQLRYQKPGKYKKKKFKKRNLIAQKKRPV